MPYDQTTARVEHEFSFGYMEQNPEFTADRLMILIKNIRASDMEISFDFSRRGFLTIRGERP
jgi:predicted oxidoreductase